MAAQQGFACCLLLNILRTFLLCSYVFSSLEYVKKREGISENDLAVQITLKINSRHDGLTRNSFLALNLTLHTASWSINRFLQVCAPRQTYGFPTVFHNLPGIFFSKERFHLCHSRMHAKPVESGIPLYTVEFLDCSEGLREAWLWLLLPSAVGGFLWAPVSFNQAAACFGHQLFL